MTRAVVIINPLAGAGRGGQIDACATLARATLAPRGYDVDVRITDAPDAAFRLASDAVASGAGVVVAWGGDGTINGAASALAGTGVPLGIVPAGSGNGLARDLGLPLEPAAALAVVVTGATRAIDAGDIEGSLFFNVAGIGLDAGIAERMAAPGARRGWLGYALATAGVLPSYRPRRYAITVDEVETLDEEAYFIALANSRQYGNGAQIAPQARLDDGKIDLVVVLAQPLLWLLSSIPAFFAGTLTERRGIRMRQGAALAITGDHDIPFHVDGEPRTGARTLNIRVRPGALTVVVRPVTAV